MPTLSSEHSQTPTQLPPAPRTFRASHRFAKLWVLKILSLPFLIAGIAAPFYWTFILLATLFSTLVPAEVTAAGQDRTYKGRLQYSLTYRYGVAGENFQDRATVDIHLFSRFQNPALVAPADRVVAIHFFRLGPFHHSTLVENSSCFNEMLSVSICLIMLEILAAYSFKVYWLDPLQVRRLYRNGSATTGVITKKIVKKRNGDKWNYLEFVYELPGSDIKTQVKTLIWSEADWRRASEGEVVTVLFEPRHLKRATLYEYAGYRVDDALIPAASPPSDPHEKTLPEPSA